MSIESIEQRWSEISTANAYAHAPTDIPLLLEVAKAAQAYRQWAYRMGAARNAWPTWRDLCATLDALEAAE